MRLSEVCTIQTGYTARSKLEPAASGGIPAIQLRDLSLNGDINLEQLTRVDLGEMPQRYFVASGDVLFRSRGDRNIATVLDGRFVEPAIAVLPLVVLRPNPAVALAEYLAWAINQPDSQRHFHTAARGTSIRMVPKASLDDLRLDVPDLETQRRIVAIDALASREEALTHRLAGKKREMTNLLLAERAKGAPPVTNPKRTGE